MTDLVVAARRMLAEKTDVRDLLGPGATSPDVEGKRVFDLWLFQWRLYISMEGTGETAIVLSQRNGWTAPNPHNTMAFPTLQLEIYSDPRRDLGNPKTATGAEQKGLALVPVLDRYLHLVQRIDGPWSWGGTETDEPVRVLGSQRLAEPEVMEVPSGDGLIRVLLRYGLSLG